MNDNDDQTVRLDRNSPGQPADGLAERPDGHSGGGSGGDSGARSGGDSGARSGGDSGVRSGGGLAGGAGGGLAGRAGGHPAGRRDGGSAGRAGGGRAGYPGLRLFALLTVIVGVIALAAAAFVFSYTGLHDIAVTAGIPGGLARFFPALPDAVLVVACAATLLLRGARWWTRWFGWLSILAIIALVGTADAVHAMAIKLPRRPIEAAAAVLPWALLLLGLWLWLSVLRHARLDAAASTTAPGAAEAPAEARPASVTSHAPPSEVPSNAATGGSGPSGVRGQSPAGPVSPPAGPVSPPAGTAPAHAATAGEVSGGQSIGLELILPPHPDDPDGEDADASAELAIETDPEPDDPASGDDGGTAPRGSFHGPAAQPSAKRPARDEDSGHPAARPFLSAPVPEPDDSKHPAPSAPAREPGKPEPPEPPEPPEQAEQAEQAEQVRPPKQPPPHPARPEHAQPPPHPAPPAEFQRVRSSPMPPGDTKR